MMISSYFSLLYNCQIMADETRVGHKNYFKEQLGRWEPSKIDVIQNGEFSA